MSSQTTITSPVGDWRSLRVSWRTVALFAVVIAFVDGVVVTTLQGAVGSIERNHPPFERWWRDSTLRVPLYVGAVLVALLIARRLVGQSRHAARRVGVAAVLVIAICTTVGIAEVANSSAYDYHLQTQHLDLMDQLSHSHSPDPLAVGAVEANIADACIELCAAKQATLSVHVRAVTYASLALLLANLVVVAWLLVLRSDRLWLRRVTEQPEPVLVTGHAVTGGGVEKQISQLTTISAVAGVGAGAIHAVAIGAHAGEPVLANIFVAVAVAQLASGIALMMRPGRTAAIALVAVNAAAVVGWLTSRLVGVWFVAGLEAEPPGFADTVCASLGGVALAGAAAALAADTGRGWSRPWPTIPARSFTRVAIAVAILTVPAMSTAAVHNHEHGSDDDHAHDTLGGDNPEVDRAIDEVVTDGLSD